MMEEYLGDELMAARGHRLFPMMKVALPRGLKEEDTLVQEVKWGQGHATSYLEIDDWAAEGALAAEEVCIDGMALDVGHDFSREVREECREWLTLETMGGRAPEDPIAGWVCTDGSAVDGNGGAMSRVGASLVQLGGRVDSEAVLGWEGQLQINPLEARVFCCSLGGERLTSGDGELFTMELLMQKAVPPLIVFTDYKAIVDGLARGKRWCTAGDKKQADRWKRIWERLDRWPKNSLVAKHVKSHRELEEVESVRDRIVWLGNWIADAIAKAGAVRWRVEASIRKGYEQDWRDFRAEARLAGRVMVRAAAERPWVREGRRWAVFQEDRGLRERGPRHWLFSVGARTRCAFCPQYADTKASLRRLRWTPCKGGVEERARGKGHTLARSCDVVGGRVGIVWCVVCGAYGEESAKGLVKECPGSAKRAGVSNIKRLLGGWHPRQMRRLHAPRPVEEESDGEGVGGMPADNQEVAASRLPAAGGQEVRGPAASEGRNEEGAQGLVAFEEPPDEEWVMGGGAAPMDQGRVEGAAEAGRSGAETASAERNASGGQPNMRPNVWSIGGTTIGTITIGTMTKTGSTKRSRFRF
jgi:hypothetical protein